MTDEQSLAFGDLLRSIRLAVGLTQEELADRARLSVRGLGALERGERAHPQRQTLVLLADALGLQDAERTQFLDAAGGWSRSLEPSQPISEPRLGIRASDGTARRTAGRREWTIGALAAVLVALGVVIGVVALQARAGASSQVHTERQLPIEGGIAQHAIPMSLPTGILVDGAGHIYVSDQACPGGQICLGSQMDRMIEISQAGRMLASWSGPQTWGGPGGIGTTRQGDILVANAYRSSVVDLTSRGRIRRVWQLGNPTSGFAPTHVAVGPQGDVWVTDTDGQRVIELSSRGTLLRLWSTGTASYPSGIAVARDATLYVSDTGTNRVERITEQGRLLASWGGTGSRPGRFRDPLDLTIDRAGDVYVVDSGNDRIERFSASGRLISVMGKPGAGAGEFEHPESITLDHRGMMYVADSGNRRVQELTPAGQPVALWGRDIRDVRLCSSAQVGVDPQDSLGMFRGIRLATGEWAPKLASVGVKLLAPVLLNDSVSQGYSPQKVRQHARDCLTRDDVLAYIAPLDSTDSELAVPILNRGSMATLSSANTEDRLTDPHYRTILEPLTVAHGIPSVTYFRVVPPDSAQGPVAAEFMHRLGAVSFVAVDDSSAYNVALSRAVSRFATATLRMHVLGSRSIGAGDSSAILTSSRRIASWVLREHAGAVYCGCTTQLATAFLHDLAAGGYSGPIVGSDELQGPLQGPKHITLPRRIYATWPGPDPSQASAAFRRAFTRRYRAALQPYDAAAYDAAGVALKAIYLAARAGALDGSLEAARRAVVANVAKSDYSGATGRITFDQNGDRRRSPVSIYRFGAGQWLYVGSVPRP